MTGETHNATITKVSKSSVKNLNRKGGFTSNINTPSFFVDSAHERSRDINLVFDRL